MTKIALNLIKKHRPGEKDSDGTMFGAKPSGKEISQLGTIPPLLEIILGA
jgi:hypothetical protein